MKNRFVAFVLVLCMALALAACGNAKTEVTAESGVTAAPAAGAYEKAESPAVPEDVKAALDDALENFVGADYVPVAYIGSQLVSGTNYKLLCEQTLVTAQTEKNMAIVTVYKPLEGSAKILSVQACLNKEEESGELGGWEKAENPELTDEAKAALEKAEGGSEYTALALVAQQLVSGTNYCLFCENAAGEYVLVYVYAALSGESEITSVAGFEAA